MKLTAQIRLLPTPAQAAALKETMKRANDACNYVSGVAWDTRTFGKFKLQSLVYGHVKTSYSLTAQVVVRVVSKVADAYKLDKKTKREFRPLGAISYDSRILRYKLSKGVVSIWTVDGRSDVAFTCGKRQWELLQTQQGESNLAFVKGKFYLLSTCEVETPTPDDVEGCLGGDMGIVNVLTDSDGMHHGGAKLNGIRDRRRRQRKRLQSKGTKSAKRILKRLSRRERNFVQGENHRIAKEFVEKAKRTNRAVALETLTGIRSRVRAKKPQRSRLHSWAFADLGTKIEYKAQLLGVPVHYVDPRNTSRTCPVCGHVAKENRKTQAYFVCVSCGSSGSADHFAAIEIASRGWGEVKRPNVPENESKSVHAALKEQAPSL